MTGDEAAGADLPDYGGPDELVTVEVGEDRVAVVTLNRPERRNGWNPDMERRYFDVLGMVDGDPRVRAVVLTGAGTTFCPGVDSGRLGSIAGKTMDMSGRRSPATGWKLRKPLIAAINGGCAGMGLVQALLCDVRFAARGAKFTTAFARRGLAGEFGATWLLPRIVGTGNAAELLLSGRVFDADEAHALGMVNRVLERDELLPAARAWAADVAANCSPLSLALIGHQLRLDAQGDFDSALRRCYLAMDLAAVQPDFREGIDSFLEKRSAQFPDLPADLDPAAVVRAGLPEVDLVPTETLDR
jgi:enoyl-CoA hydratase/carnithine racemase